MTAGRTAVASAVEKLGAGSGRYGLGVRGPGASVWPVVGGALMTFALVVDQLRGYPGVPMRWMLTLVAVAVAATLAELRLGGRLAALRRLPGTSAVRLLLLLLLVAQLANFLSLGFVQVLWWAATAAVAVPVLRSHAHIPPLRLGGRLVQPAVLGAGAVLVALLVALLPGQTGVGTLWSVVAAGAALVVIFVSLRPVPGGPRLAAVSTAVIVGITVVAAGLSLVGVLWILGAWLMAADHWQWYTVGLPPLRWRSGAGVAVAGALLALAALFGQFDSAGTFGMWVGGLTTSYDVYTPPEWTATAYYLPGTFHPASGRGQPVAPLVAAGLVAAVVVSRRGMRRASAAAGGSILAAGAFVWGLVEGDLGYVAVWVFLVGAATLLGWSASRLSANIRRSAHGPA